MVRNWEYGSEFDWPFDLARSSPLPNLPWGNAVHASTARDCIRSLFRMAIGRLGWKRVFLPSYFCGEVIDTIHSLDIDFQGYSDLPGSKLSLPYPQHVGDVLFISNTFGLRKRPGELDGGWTAIIEDHTHDPLSAWALQSSAHYCIASLRKTLPIPDGAVMWSPRNLPLPTLEEQSSDRRASVFDKMTAMMLKSDYLAGALREKKRYRDLATRGEMGLASGVPMCISDVSLNLLRRMPLSEWRAQRARNHDSFVSMLSGQKWLKVLAPEESGCCPFSFCFLTSSAELRNELREHLIRNSVYPAILWPIESKSDEAARRVSDCILCIPCDMRYGKTDLEKVSAIIGEFADQRQEIIRVSQGLS